MSLAQTIYRRIIEQLINDTLERMERKRSWPNLSYNPNIFLEGLKETTKILSGYSVSGPKFESGTSQIRSRSANHSIAMSPPPPRCKDTRQYLLSNTLNLCYSLRKRDRVSHTHRPTNLLHNTMSVTSHSMYVRTP
jgi:hypothetical protein